MEGRKVITRGRPRCATAGATDAFDLIKDYLDRNDLSLNQLAIHCGLTSSSVTRALSSRNAARWTPTFKAIYRIALNKESNLRISPAMKRLAAYQGPGELEVKRLLTDVDALLTTLSASKHQV